jgi:hypothetical protein
MQTVMNKILKVVDSCMTPQQLEVAGHSATLVLRFANTLTYI